MRSAPHVQDEKVYAIIVCKAKKQVKEENPALPFSHLVKPNRLLLTGYRRATCQDFTSLFPDSKFKGINDSDQPWADTPRSAQAAHKASPLVGRDNLSGVTGSDSPVNLYSSSSYGTSDKKKRYVSTCWNR